MLLSLAATLFLIAPAASGDGQSELGLEMVPWSKKVGDRRYESPRDFDGTVKFFRDKFKGSKAVKWSREVSLPAVKYVHMENLTTNSKWSGINIYLMNDQRVRVYVLERVPETTAAS